MEVGSALACIQESIQHLQEIVNWDDADDHILRRKDSMEFDLLLEQSENLRDSYKDLYHSILRELGILEDGDRLPYQASV